MVHDSYFRYYDNKTKGTRWSTNILTIIKREIGELQMHSPLYCRRCNIQTNEYDLKAIIFLIISTHRRLHSSNGDKIQAFRRSMWSNAQSMKVNHLRGTNTEKYDNDGKSWYFQFDDDDKMSYKYVPSIT